ncbi:hypothetical protein MRX96_004955 [Rhipicephalus microplus]
MVSEASPTCNKAPSCSLASAIGTWNIEHPDRRLQVNQPVSLIDREDQHVEVVALVVSNGCCTRVHTCYFVDDSMLKWNDEETHQYTSASSCVAQAVSVRKSNVIRENHLATDRSSTGHGLSLTASINGLLAAGNGTRLNRRTQRAAYGRMSRDLGWLDQRVPGCGKERSVLFADGGSLELWYHHDDASTALSPMNSASAGGCHNLLNAWGRSSVGGLHQPPRTDRVYEWAPISVGPGSGHP